MRLSDVHCRKPEPLYLNHSTLLDINEAATRRSNGLLGVVAQAPHFDCEFYGICKFIQLKPS